MAVDAFAYELAVRALFKGADRCCCRWRCRLLCGGGGRILTGRVCRAHVAERFQHRRRVELLVLRDRDGEREARVRQTSVAEAGWQWMMR